MLRNKKCVECGASISASDTVCHYCGAIQVAATSKNTFVPEGETEKHRKSYLDGRSYLLEGEKIVGAFVPDKAFKRRAFRSAFLASFISLLLVTGFGILTETNGFGSVSTLNVFFATPEMGKDSDKNLPLSRLSNGVILSERSVFDRLFKSLIMSLATGYDIGEIELESAFFPPDGIFRGRT